MPAFSPHYLFARELMEQIEAMTPETRLDPDAVYSVSYTHLTLPTN